MAAMRTLIHSGPGGDRWFLCHGDEPTDVFVFHEPEGSSTGGSARIELVDFLARDPGSPQAIGLLALIGSLVEAGHVPPGTGSAAPEPGAAAAEPTPGEALTSP